MNSKKMRKLLRDPKLFFKDMLHKRLPRKSSIPTPFVKKKGKYSYSVIAAVYGVEKYLDDFFKSLVSQSLDFKSHIQLVMVDDGSLDGSAGIIKKWQKKYPNNIVYISKKNGGQASARNLGMDHATGEWFSFIDPDDFVDKEYFYEIDRHIAKQKQELLFVGCNLIYFHENKNQFSDTHPLNHRFKKEAVVRIDEQNVFYQLSLSSAVFNAKKIFEHGIKSNENIKPNFEDGEFIARLSLLEDGSHVSFLPSAKYFYRKRSDGSSTLDNSFFDQRRYSELFDNAHLNILSLCDSHGRRAPLWLQNTLLYEIFWNIKSVLSSGHKLTFMTDDFKAAYKDKLKKIISHIDDDVILEFSLAGCWFYHKVGILGLFKGVSPDFSIAYVDSWDASNKLLCVRYFWSGDLPIETVMVGGREVLPACAKSMRHDFLGDEFVCERRLWIPMESTEEIFSLSLNEQNARISLQGKQLHSGVRCSQIAKAVGTFPVDPKKINILAKPLRHQASTLSNRKKFKNAWVFMDRDTMADDNAEHLYRHVAANHPDINAFFALRKTSPDWLRLAQEGFKLLDFDSEEHRIALLNAEFLISSHADAYVVDLLPKKDYGDMLRFKYVFLQHGVTKDDLSKWLNNKPISLFVTATMDEYRSVVDDGVKYKFGKNEVSLTGFPRHDALLKLNSERKANHKKKIVIMPTWRNGLVGATLGSGNERSVNEHFFASNYAKAWKDFLHSDNLRKLADESDADLVFYPHANIVSYIDGFDVPSYISVKRNFNEESMQKIFVETDLLITDYSSVAFEVAYLKKPVIYYQFDRDEVFSGGHIYEKGYFDYDVDGFGPVCMNLDDVLSCLEQYLESPNGEMWAKYERIADATFAHRDGNCCKRTIEAIQGLQNPVLISLQDQILQLRASANDALEKSCPHTALNRYRHCFELSADEADARQLLRLLAVAQKHDEVLKLYEAHGAAWTSITQALCLDSLVALGCFRYVTQVLGKVSEPDVLVEHAESILKYGAWKQDEKVCNFALQELPHLNPGTVDFLNSYIQRDWASVRAKLRFSPREVLVNYFDLMLQACFRTGNVEYVAELFDDLKQFFSPLLEKMYCARVGFALGDFDSAYSIYKNISEKNVDAMCREDVVNWLRLRLHKFDASIISSEAGMALLRRFADDEEISCFVMQETQCIKNGYCEEILGIFPGGKDTSPKISLCIFKDLLSLGLFQEAEKYVNNASFAAQEDKDQVLIADFKMVASKVLELA